MTATCDECGRVFDLLDETDADEWAFGHDCEAERFVREHIVVIPVVIPPPPANAEPCDECSGMRWSPATPNGWHSTECSLNPENIVG